MLIYCYFDVAQTLPLGANYKLLINSSSINRIENIAALQNNQLVESYNTWLCIHVNHQVSIEDFIKLFPCSLVKELVGHKACCYDTKHNLIRCVRLVISQVWNVIRLKN